MLKSKRLRLTLSLVITALTIGLFTYYLLSHPELFHQLMKTPPLTVGLLLLLFAGWFGTLALILQACLRICNVAIPMGENLTINAYSTFLNYLLPGQGGVVLRGVYLKGRHKLPLRRYVFVTLIYYFIYVILSTLLLLGGAIAWWQTLIGVIVVGTGAYFGARFYARRRHLSSRGLNFNFENIAYLIFATTLQAVFQIAIYGVELRNVDATITLAQIVTYTGAAGFALFISITPGAIGIRESLLVFSQRLHHVSNTAIVGANVLDRATYILLLVIMFLVLVAVRGKSVFSVKLGRKDSTADVAAGVLQQDVRPRDA